MVQGQLRVNERQIEGLTDKVNQLKEDQKQREKIVNNKWQPIIASLEQQSMVISRDRQMVEFNQKGEGRMKEEDDNEQKRLMRPR